MEELVTEFWEALLEKNTKLLREFYSPDAITFGSQSQGSESGASAASRRAIEYFGEQMKLTIQLGAVRVQTINLQAAIASYTFSFSAVETNKDGEPANVYERIGSGRATQVFALDRVGIPRIVHEHFSTIPTARRTPDLQVGG